MGMGHDPVNNDMCLVSCLRFNRLEGIAFHTRYLLTRLILRVQFCPQSVFSVSCKIPAQKLILVRNKFSLKRTVNFTCNDYFHDGYCFSPFREAFTTETG